MLIFQLTDDSFDSFVSDWSDNKVKVVMFDSRKQPCLRFLMAAFAHRDHFKSGYYHLGRLAVMMTMKSMPQVMMLMIRVMMITMKMLLQMMMMMITMQMLLQVMMMMMMMMTMMMIRVTVMIRTRSIRWLESELTIAMPAPMIQMICKRWDGIISCFSC